MPWVQSAVAAHRDTAMQMMTFQAEQPAHQGRKAGMGGLLVQHLICLLWMKYKEVTVW